MRFFTSSKENVDPVKDLWCFSDDSVSRTLGGAAVTKLQLHKRTITQRDSLSGTCTVIENKDIPQQESTALKQHLLRQR